MSTPIGKKSAAALVQMDLAGGVRPVGIPPLDRSLSTYSTGLFAERLRQSALWAPLHRLPRTFE
jgi:hypothetical protein